jgi:hypothetical protein
MSLRHHRAQSTQEGIIATRGRVRVSSDGPAPRNGGQSCGGDHRPAARGRKHGHHVAPAGSLVPDARHIWNPQFPDLFNRTLADFVTKAAAS